MSIYKQWEFSLKSEWGWLLGLGLEIIKKDFSWLTKGSEVGLCKIWLLRNKESLA